jgi:hypothetical protein
LMFLYWWVSFACLALINLTFMDPCIVNVFSSITNKMQRYTRYLFLWNALHVSGGSSPHHKELKTVYTASDPPGTCRAFHRNKYVV